jgi:DNA repair protein RadC
MASKSKGKTPASSDILEAEWLKIGISGPARKALVDAKLYKVSDLRKITLNELVSLHGMGKSSIARIQVIMKAKKISFAIH